MCQSPVSSSQNVTGVMRDSLGLLGSVRNAAAQARERALALADDAAAKETVELGSLHLSQALMKLDQLLARHQGKHRHAPVTACVLFAVLCIQSHTTGHSKTSWPATHPFCMWLVLHAAILTAPWHT